MVKESVSLSKINRREKILNQHTAGQVENGEWLDVAQLIAEGVPNAIFTKLGRSFSAAFYKRVSAQDYSFAYVARDNAGTIVGVIIGTLDYLQAYSIALKSQRLKLLLAANFRLLSWSVISWVVKGVLEGFKSKARVPEDQPKARLLVISIRPGARGKGLGISLIKRMEQFMQDKGLTGPYLILTEKSNVAANRFYEKIGAKLIRTNIHHRRKINEWHKVIGLDAKNEK